MTAYEIIARKRDKQSLSTEEIDYFISSFMKEDITDYQMTALLMAIYLQGMNFEETRALTNAYIQSGTHIDLSPLGGKKVDKHSTGGVGDKVSIILAPLVASLGVTVPMMSGRGLGHSGGTLDKLESIPGFRTDLSRGEFLDLLKQHRMALIGQTRDLVPADKRIYALRDVTATVDCIPLICASIMSKKIAEGIDALVLDVKFGSGAFMKDAQQAESLAGNLIEIGKAFDTEVTAVLTSMERPLGKRIGNWLEVVECLECFQGNGPEDLLEVTLRLAAHMLLLGEAAASLEEAEQSARRALESGRAFEKFLEIARAQGADITFLEHPDKYSPARERATLTADRDGYVGQMNTFEIGMTSVQLGAGRRRAEDGVDPRAGIVLHRKPGEKVTAGDALCEIHTNRAEAVEPALQRLRKAIPIRDEPVRPGPLILKELRS